MRIPIMFTAAALLAVFLVACAGMPQVELEAAQAAKQEAEAERAAMLAPSDWQDAMESWDEAQEQIRQENYSQARRTLLTTKSRFQKARDISRSMRDQIRSETQGTRDTVKDRYERMKETAASGRMSAAKKRDLEKAFADIDEALSKLDEMIEGGQYVEARDHSASVMRLVLEAEQHFR